MRICPKCGSVVTYNSYFSAYLCDRCDWQEKVPACKEENENTLQYKGYITRIQFSAADHVLHGKLEGIDDLVTFESDSAVDIEKQFHDAVDSYLELKSQISAVEFPLKAEQLADYIVKKCIDDHKPITIIILLMILYIIQAEYHKQGKVAFLDVVDFSREFPMIENVYYKYCGFGAMPITIRNPNTPGIFLDKENKSIIDPIVQDMREQYGWYLIEKVQELRAMGL